MGTWWCRALGGIEGIKIRKEKPDLPQEEIERVSREFSILKYPPDTVLFVQGQSKVEYLYIIQKGAAERYFEENDRKTLRGLLGEGDMYGGISILLNNGIPIRTLRITEESWLYILPKEKFLEICSQHEAFTEFFTDTFPKFHLCFDVL